ncbi:MAG: ATPase domain-containing protein [Candidatus Micrarchaeota archaeon]
MNLFPIAKEGRRKGKGTGAGEFIPLRVSHLDELIDKHGVERGSTLLISGGCGTGKSTFCMQSVYNSALHGERGIYISFEESPEKLRRHMLGNFGWDLEKLEDEGRLALLRIDPFELARSVEAAVAHQREKLLIEVKDLELPFKPDRVVIDSLTALSSAFMEHAEEYRTYVRHLFKTFASLNAVTFAITETEQEPRMYSRLGIEEFLSDGVIVMYNIKKGVARERGIEILKMRCCGHVRRIVPYEITNRGIAIHAHGRIHV